MTTEPGYGKANPHAGWCGKGDGLTPVTPVTPVTRVTRVTRVAPTRFTGRWSLICSGPVMLDKVSKSSAAIGTINQRFGLRHRKPAQVIRHNPDDVRAEAAS